MLEPGEETTVVVVAVVISSFAYPGVWTVPAEDKSTIDAWTWMELTALPVTIWISDAVVVSKIISSVLNNRPVQY